MKNMKKLLVAFFMLVTVVGYTTTGPAAAEESLISLSFDEVPLSTVLNVLSRKTGRKFITDTTLAKKRIVLNLRDVTASEALNALLDTYNLYYVRQADTNIYVIKSKTEGTVTTVSEIIYCNYAKASELKDVVVSQLTRGGNISADTRTNSLIVTDMADNIEKIKYIIRELDTPTPQVMLETRIIDLKLSKTINSGIDINELFRVKQPGIVYSQGFAPGSDQSSQAAFGIIEQGYNIDAVVEFLQNNTDAKVITNPKLIVLNNQTANINITDEYPYQEKTESTEGAAAVTSTSFKEIGVKVEVRPQINRDGTIVLEITPEQSFNKGLTVDNIPIINKSKVTTTFMIEDGQTAVIGGLIRDSKTSTEHKVPIIGDIPIIGYLFKRVGYENERTEMTVFVTAHIIQGTKHGKGDMEE